MKKILGKEVSIEKVADVSGPLVVTSLLYRQYKIAKEQCPEAIALFRVGDFYEAYYDDAELIAAKLGLVLRKRDGAPMAAFPYHQLDIYPAKLVAGGYRVAICEPTNE